MYLLYIKICFNTGILVYTVALKGRVALQMGSNELLITELILKNVLTVLQPAEIAALLSALIFQQRTDSEPMLTSNLTNVHYLSYFDKLRKYVYYKINLFF